MATIKTEKTANGEYEAYFKGVLIADIIKSLYGTYTIYLESDVMRENGINGFYRLADAKAWLLERQQNLAAAATVVEAPASKVNNIEIVIATEVVIEEMCELAHKSGATPEQMMEWAKSPEGLQTLASRVLEIAGLTPPAPVAPVIPTPADLAEIVAAAGGEVASYCELQSEVTFTKDGVTFELANSGSRYHVRAVNCANYAATLYRNYQDQRTAGNLQGGQTPEGCLDFIAQTVAKYGDKAQDRAARDAAWKAASEAETARINAIYDAPDTQAAPVAIIEGGKDYTGENLTTTITVKKSIVGKPDGTAVVTTADGTVEVLAARTDSAHAQPDAEAELQAAEAAARERRDEAIAFAEERLTEKYEAEKAAAQLVCKMDVSPCKFQNLDAAMRNIEVGYQVEYKRAHSDAWAAYEADIEKARSVLRAARIAQNCIDEKQAADAAHKERIEAAEWAAQGAEQAQAQEPKKIQLTPALLALNKQANEIYDFNKITEYIADLNRNGFTQVGYLASCGRTHATQKVFRLWEKAVKLIEKQGFTLTKENIKQRNAYATTNGGFRTETKYTIV